MAYAERVLKRPPAAVRVVAHVLCLAAAVSFVTGSSLLFPGSMLQRIWELNQPAYVAFARFGWISGVFLLALGVLSIAAGAGLFAGKRWAWWLAIVLFAVNGFGDLIALVVRRDFVRSTTGILAASLFLLCLLSSGAKRYFRDATPAAHKVSQSGRPAL